ncbi:hypothetical protein HY419_01550, partial [candidate division WWE3 bacterium]|nr:hypothetical protein [candidate division WWE3 bacterium]
MFTKRRVNFFEGAFGSLRSGVLSGTLIVAVGMFLSNILSYLLQLVLGNYLSAVDYGEFLALLSLIYIFSVPVGAVGTAIIKVTSELRGENRFDTLTDLFVRFTKLLAVLSFLFLLLLTLGKERVSAYLNLGDPSLVVVFAVFLFLSFLMTTPISYLQGLLRFKAFSFITVMGSLLR